MYLQGCGAWEPMRQLFSSAYCWEGSLLDTAGHRGQDSLERGQNKAARRIRGLRSLTHKWGWKEIAWCHPEDYRKMCWKFCKQASSVAGGEGSATARQHYKEKGFHSKVHRVTNVTSRLICVMNLHLSFLERSSSTLPHTTEICGA